jgi:hypothetical protein
MRFACGHAPITEPRRVCPHLVASDPRRHHLRFTGSGVNCALVCPSCIDAPDSTFVAVCDACAGDAEEIGDGRVVGAPKVRIRPSPLPFEHDVISLPALARASLAAFAALPGAPRSRWLAVVDDELLGFDLDGREVVRLASLRAAPIDLAAPLSVRTSPCGRFAAVVNEKGRHGTVVDLASGTITMSLDRGDYFESACTFAAAFFQRGDRMLLVHATDWNRLDVSDPATGRLLTPREELSWRSEEPPPARYLDYFHSSLAVSPEGTFVADGGWVWQPMGVVVTWNLRRWLDDNPYESEDGPSRRELTWREPWDVGMCFVDDRTLALWGYGRENLIPAVQLFDVESGHRRSWFAGVPVGVFSFDRWLFSVSKTEGTSVWDVATGERVAEDRTLTAAVHHPSTHELVMSLGEGRFRKSWMERLAEA